MPDFDKVASFELIHYMVNYDIDGSLSDLYATIQDFPPKGEVAKVKVPIRLCTLADVKKYFNPLGPGKEPILESIIGSLYCIQNPE